jgi:DNA-binding response OmpR family regulator
MAPGHSVAGMSVTTTGPLEIREDETDVLADGTRVGLTVREFEVFLALASHPDRVVQRPDIYREVWNAPMPYRDRAVDVFVRKVRQKLEEAAPDWTFIHTHFGIGYRFSPEPRVK